MSKFIIPILVVVLFISNNTFAQSASKIAGVNNPDKLVNYLSMSFDSKQMVYAKRTKGETQYAFYERIYDNNAWGAEKEISAINSMIKPTSKIGGTCFHYNGEVLYFSIDISDGNGMDIYFTKKTGNTWTEAKKFSSIINTKENESDPSISPDGNTFFFVRDMKLENDYSKEFSCKTIYISEKSITGIWGKPYRMSMKINSGCEMSPRISSDNKTLFFSSVRGDRKLGFDIYSTKMVAKGIWSTPARIDTICDEYSNIYPNISFNGDKIFYINQTKLGKKKEEDIVYSSFLSKKYSPKKNMILEGKVTDLYNGKIIDAEIKIINPFTSIVISKYKTNKNTGQYWFMLSADKNYRIEFLADGYSHNIKSYIVPKLKSNKIEKRDIKLYPDIYVILNVFDAENFQPLKSEIKIIDTETNNPINIDVKQLVLGRFKLKLPIGKEYKILASKKNYITNTLTFNIKKIVQFDEFEKDIELTIKKRDFTISVKDKKTSEPIKVDILVKNKLRKEKIVLKSSDGNQGNYAVKLREGDAYNIEVLPDGGYAYYSTFIDLKTDKSSTLDVNLMSLKQNEKIELKNIIFETNSSELATISYKELDRVVELMKTNPKLKVEVSAHTDNVGSDAYNLKLSERRAQSDVN